MEIPLSTDSSKECTLSNLTENRKRWCAYGIALNHVLIPAIRPVLDKEILKEYNDLVSSCGINVQTAHNFPTPKYPTSMNYKNINGNDKKPFDYKVNSHIDFSKLFLKDFMAKLSAFDETCDASAVLTLLERIPIFPADVQNAAKDVRVDRNAWGHSNFTEWDDSKFRKRFDSMEKLVGEVDPADKSKVIADLNDWKERGVILCMNATIDPELAKTIQERVSKLSSGVEEIAVEGKEEMDNLSRLDNAIENIEKRFEKMEQKFGELQVSHDQAVRQRVAKLEECSSFGQNKRRDLLIGALCSGMSVDGGDIIFHISSNKARICKDPVFTDITLRELLDASEIMDPTFFKTSVKRCFGGYRTDQKVEVKHGSTLDVVKCFTDERFLAVIDDFESGRLKERLLEEFSPTRVETEAMEIEIMNKEEVRETKESIKERNEIKTRIFVMIKEGNLEEVRLFVESGVNVNTKIRQNMTMLHLASQFGSLDIVQYLVERGAKVTNEDDNCQETVLHSACRGGNNEIVEYLLQHGAEKDIDKENHSGCSPLSIACCEGHSAIVRTLKKHHILAKKKDGEEEEDSRLWNKQPTVWSTSSQTSTLFNELLTIPPNTDQRYFASYLIDHTGGEVALPCTGIRMVIPEGALDFGRTEAIYIALASSDFIPKQYKTSMLTPVVMCGPHGLRFKKHVLLILPHCLAVGHESEREFKVHCSDTAPEDAPDWKEVFDANGEEQKDVFCHMGKRRFNLFVQHFSWYVIEGKGYAKIFNLAAYHTSFHQPNEDFKVRVYFSPCVENFMISQREVEKHEQQLRGTLGDSEKTKIFYKEGGDIKVEAIEISEGWKIRGGDVQTQGYEMLRYCPQLATPNLTFVFQHEDTRPEQIFCKFRTSQDACGYDKPVDITLSVHFEAEVKTAQQKQQNNAPAEARNPSTPSSGYAESGENTTVAFIPTRLRKDLRELLDIEIVGIGNYEVLADRLGYGMQFIRWLGSPQMQSPTDTLLTQWENDQGSRSPRDALRHLQETLSKMNRVDAVDKIQECFDEFLIGKETTV